MIDELPAITTIRIRVDGISMTMTVFDDLEGERLQKAWKDYMDSRILPHMNPATLYQLDRM